MPTGTNFYGILDLQCIASRVTAASSQSESESLNSVSQLESSLSSISTDTPHVRS